jgi:hypothetical protein
MSHGQIQIVSDSAVVKHRRAQSPVSQEIANDSQRGYRQPLAGADGKQLERDMPYRHRRTVDWDCGHFPDHRFPVVTKRRCRPQWAQGQSVYEFRVVLPENLVYLIADVSDTVAQGTNDDVGV